MKRVANVMFLLALILIMPTATRACLCSNSSFSPVNAFYGADVVFIGKVTKITNAKQASVGLIVRKRGLWLYSNSSLGKIRIPGADRYTGSERIL